MFRSLILAAGTLLSALPSAAETMDLDQLAQMLPLAGFEVAAASVERQDATGLRLGRVDGFWHGSRVTATGVDISWDDAVLTIDLGLVLLRGGEGAGPDVMTSGSFTLLPPQASASADPVCHLLQRLQSARLAGTTIAWRDTMPGRRAGPVSRLRIDRLDITARPDPAACRFTGDIDIGATIVDMLSGVSLSFMTLTLDGTFPADVQTAQEDLGNLAMTIEIAGLEQTSAGEVPSFGAERIDLTLNALARNSTGLLFFLRSMMTEAEPMPAARRLLEGWNAFHILQPDMALSADRLRLFLPGVIPTELHANFRRAGLTNAHGSARISLTGDRGARDLQLEAAVNGVADLRSLSRFRTVPVRAQSIRTIIDEGLPLLALDMAGLSSITIEYTDRGMNRVSTDMFGIPAGRLVEELVQILDEESASRSFMGFVLQKMSRAFRLAVDGGPVMIRGTFPESGMSIPGSIARWQDEGAGYRPTITLQNMGNFTE